MQEIDLLAALPKSQKNIKERASYKTPEIVRISKQFGEEYFDGPRTHGYGGYRYDGRWIPVAKDIINHFQLKPGERVLDIGCAKGFLVKDLMAVCPGLEVFGLDISEYALKHCEPEVVGRLHLGNAKSLPFPDNTFDCVISINTIHNLTREEVIVALKEIERVSRGPKSFVQVDSYYTPEEKELFESWVLTAEFHDYPEGWGQVFKESGYQGDYYWTLA